MPLNFNERRDFTSRLRAAMGGRLGSFIRAAMARSRGAGNRALAESILESMGINKKYARDYQDILNIVNSLIPAAPVIELAPLNAPPKPGEQPQRFTPIRTPASSNVYSFWWEPAVVAQKREYIGHSSRTKQGTLYVTFLAPAVSAKFNRTTGQLTGKLGSTVKGKRPNTAGPTYAYFGTAITYQLYESMVNYTKHTYAGHAGIWIWNFLRKRPSHWEHQPGVSYRLVQGSVGAGQHQGTYVPRRATRTGFSRRGVFDVSGKKVGVSTLPSQKWFTTRRRI